MSSTENTEALEFPSSALMGKLSKDVTNLRCQANMNRKKTSETIGELLKFVEQTQEEDALLNGIAANNNPFIEKKACSCL